MFKFWLLLILSTVMRLTSWKQTFLYPLVIELLPGVEKLIDDNHRLQKALRLGITTFPVYRLTFQQHRRFIVDYDEAPYQQVIRHWTT